MNDDDTTIPVEIQGITLGSALLGVIGTCSVELHNSKVHC